MASTFLGLSIASRGLNAAQVGLSVTTNNMSNIDTTGYSRQVVNQTSIGPAAVYSSSLVGAGVEVTSVDNVRSFRLDQKYWKENAAASKLEAENTYLEQIEEVFGSTDSSSISTALDDFYSALETLSTDPSDAAAREVVLENAKNLCSVLNETAASLTDLRNDLNSEVKTAVAQINSYAAQIAALNQQIAVASASGASTNELEDQRALLVDELSGLVGISVTECDDGSLTITVEGATLVKGNKARELECYTVTDSTSDQYGMYGIRWSDTGASFDSGDSGALNGYLAVRDGNSSSDQGIPYYLSQLNEFARTFAQAFNEGVTAGSTEYSGHADGTGLDDSTGIRFFTYDGLSSDDFLASGSDTSVIYQNITAANISVSADIQENTDKIAAASSSGGEDNSENLADLISICGSVNISGNATVTDLYNALVAKVATHSAGVQAAYNRKSTIVSYLENSRSSVSGVSSDEETVNLATYQAAYAASAKMVTAWSELYQTTINMVNDD